jgi:hypothetical protein
MGLLVLGDICWLHGRGGSGQVHINSQLCRAQTHQLVEYLERLLFRKPVVQTHEGNLISEAKPVVGSPALSNLLQVFPVQACGAFELLAGEHVRL